MASVSFLLDTTILLHWTRDSKQAQEIESQFKFTQAALRPLICEVSIGEMRAFSQSMNWGAAKRARLLDIVERQCVVVRIGHPWVMQAYADLSTLSQSKGWSLFHGKNDLWVAAAAKASDAHLVTMDKDFLPLSRLPGWKVTVLDEGTGKPLP